MFLKGDLPYKGGSATFDGLTFDVGVQGNSVLQEGVFPLSSEIVFCQLKMS